MGDVAGSWSHAPLRPDCRTGRQYISSSHSGSRDDLDLYSKDISGDGSIGDFFPLDDEGTTRFYGKTFR